MNDELPALTGDEFRTDEQEFEAIFTRLRAELHVHDDSRGDAADPAETARAVMSARREGERLWAVTAERPYQFKPGRLGRLRGWLLMPMKVPMRRLMRWYVQPLAVDQRHFNAAVLRLVDAYGAETRANQRELREVLEHLAAAIGHKDSGDATRELEEAETKLAALRDRGR